MQAKTYPYNYADGYVITDMFTTGWEEIFYAGLYKETKLLPFQWNKEMKKSKPVAIFIMSEWRTKIKEKGKLWYGCAMMYKYSAN